MSKLIIAQALVETSTPISDHIIAVFAFFTFSSSQAETKYIIQATTKASTDNTATYSIAVEIRFHKNQKKPSCVSELFTCQTPSSSHQGSPLQTTPGHEANIFVVKRRKGEKKVIIFIFI